MNIVNFTPVSALIGGMIIGLSVFLFFILNGPNDRCKWNS